MDEVFSYTHLIGGIYLSAAISRLDPAERESQLEAMTHAFTALEKATQEYERKASAAELAEKAVAVTSLPPHQYLWALYAGGSV